VRLLTLQSLNTKLTSMLGMIDFAVQQGASELADGVRSIRGLIFFSVKNALWKAALAATQSAGNKNVRVSLQAESSAAWH